MITLDELLQDGVAAARERCEAEMWRGLSALYEPDQVIELRAPKVHRPRGAVVVASGYYGADQREALVRDALSLLDLEGRARGAIRGPRAEGIYTTLQVVDPVLAARPRLQLGGRLTTTRDDDVTRYRWLPIDVDPVRRAGLSATDGEVAAANGVMPQLMDALVGDARWPLPLWAQSGNGLHLLWRVDVEADAPGRALIADCLAVLGAAYSDEQVTLDTGNGNPSRIWKMYGSIAGKGEHWLGEPEPRPHRLAVLGEPQPPSLGVVPRHLLEALAAMRADLPSETPGGRPSAVRVAGGAGRPVRGASPTPAAPLRVGADGTWRLEDWASGVGLALPEPRPWDSASGAGQKWLLADACGRGCADGAALMRDGLGRISFTCHHASCPLSDWQSFRELHEPGYAERREGREARAAASVAGPSRKVVPIRGGVVAAAAATLDDEEEEPDPDPGPQARRSGAEDQSWKERLRWTKSGLAKTPANANLICRYDPAMRDVLAFDDFLGRACKVAPPPWLEEYGLEYEHGEVWDDEDDTRLMLWLDEVHGVTLRKNQISGLVAHLAKLRRYHPVREWLTSLKWDGVARIDRWLIDYLGAEDKEYHQLVGAWWLISGVARAMTPGDKVDHVLILEGEQGLKKSTAFKVLLPNKRWLYDSELAIGSKDAYISIQGKFLVELPEMSAMSKRDEKQLKQFFTQSLDSYRGVHATYSQDHERQCIFGGTYNPLEGTGYFHDPTGNRRYWPVAVTRRGDRAIAANRDQLWAEAVARWRFGQDDPRGQWWPESEEHAELCRQEQLKRTDEDVWTSTVLGWLAERQAQGEHQVTSAQVLTQCIKLDLARATTADARRVARILKQAEGWSAGVIDLPSTKGTGRRQARGYILEKSLRVAADPELEASLEADPFRGL